MIGRIASLHRYPVKGLRGHALDAIDVEACGLAGDRRWMVVDDIGRFITQRECNGMAAVSVQPVGDAIALGALGQPEITVPMPPPAGTATTVTVWRSSVSAQDAGDAAAAWLSNVLQRSCRLVHMGDPRARRVDPAYGQADDHVSFADGYPVLLTCLGSLDHLNARLEQPVPISRFRPNIVVEGSGAWAEDSWRRIRIGEIVFRLPKPCARCLVTSIDQQTGARPDPHEPLHTLGRFRRSESGIVFGQNMIPVNTGRLAVGDAVEVLEASSPA